MNHSQLVLHIQPGGVQTPGEVTLVAVGGAVDAKLLKHILLPHDDPAVAFPGEEHLAQHQEHRGVEEGQRSRSHGIRHLQLRGAHVSHESELTDAVDDKLQKQFVQARTDAGFVGQER